MQGTWIEFQKVKPAGVLAPLAIDGFLGVRLLNKLALFNSSNLVVNNEILWEKNYNVSLSFFTLGGKTQYIKSNNN